MLRIFTALDMPHLTFDEFKTGFEFTLEAFGLSGALVTLWYRFDIVRSVWRVVRGRATRQEENSAAQGVRDMGPIADRILDRLANHFERHGHELTAGRVRGLESSRQPTPTPEQMV